MQRREFLQKSTLVIAGLPFLLAMSGAASAQTASTPAGQNLTTVALNSGGNKLVPGKAYRLSFNAAGNKGDSEWVLYLRDADGKLLFDGVLQGEWQKLKPGTGEYSHLFYAPEGAATFELKARNAQGAALQNVKLEELTNSNLILNGDFSGGANNYSGWSETYNTRFVEHEGKPALHINQNGYALTDYIPVAGGGSYKIKGTQTGMPGSLLAYDALRNFIHKIAKERDGSFTVPQNTAWLRVMYDTWHDHLPRYRENAILAVELQPLQASEVAPSNIKQCDEWEIVLSPQSEPREEYSARELRGWMTAISGKAPALLAEASKATTRKIFVGRAWAGAFADDLKKLAGSDGYAVRTRNNDIYLFSAHPRGVLYGVHTLLERNTDIIWPRPNPEFAAIYTKTPSIKFAAADFLSLPTFEERYVSRGRGELPFQDWLGRNGLNTPLPMHTGNDYLAWQRGAQLGYGGSYMSWIGDARNKDEKILPLVDGKRDTSRWRQPCYTYNGTVDAMVAGFKKRLATLPGREIEHLHATLADNWTVCGCPNCMAPIKLPDGRTLTATSSDAGKNALFFSTRNYIMLNQVAEILVKEFPDIKIQTHAYIFTAEPPAVPVHPAIIPEFAAYPTQNVRFPILAGKGQKISIYDENIWKRRFDQWGKIKKGELGFFGYYYTPGFNALADTAAQDYRALAGFDAVQAHTEGFPMDNEELSAWDADAIEKWVIAKLMWDPSQDPEALRKTYISRVYGGAEKEMTAFYKLIRDAWHNAPESVFVNCHSAPDRLFQEIIINSGIEKPAKELLVAAAKTATSPQSKQIVQRHQKYFDELGSTLGRLAVPHVEEAKNEWSEATSPHWEKAVLVKDFLKVSDWRHFDKAAAAHQTSVRLMHDLENLYVRFDGTDENLAGLVKPAAPAGNLFPKGDRFELRLHDGKQSYYVAAGPGGHSISQPALGDKLKSVVAQDDNSWTAILAIPLNAIGADNLEGAPLKARFGRVYRAQGEEREESSNNGAGIFNPHESFWSQLQIK